MIDTHAHLYIEDFDIDRREIIESALSDNISEIWLPAIDSTYYKEMISIKNDFSQNIRLFTGLHPCYVTKANYKQELKIVENNLNNNIFEGIGEIGIDLYWDKSTFEIQKIAFEQQINWAIDKKIPILIHARESIPEIILILKKFKSSELRGIFHCWTGTYEQALEVIDLGFLLGIGGVVTFKNGKINNYINKINLKNIVLETDSPYLSPAPFRGKRNEPKYLNYILEELNKLYQIPKNEISLQTTENAKKLL